MSNNLHWGWFVVYAYPQICFRGDWLMLRALFSEFCWVLNCTELIGCLCWQWLWSLIMVLILEARWFGLEKGYWIWCSGDLDEWASAKGLCKQLCRFCLWISWGFTLSNCHVNMGICTFLMFYGGNSSLLLFFCVNIASWPVIFIQFSLSSFCCCSQSSSKGKGDEYWLIWRFEGEATLSDLMLSKEFPYNVGISPLLNF